jgi:polyhydroxybutyrate depolymerase
MKTLPIFSVALGITALASGQPVILMQPQDQTNVLGTTASFSVTASNALPLTYQWVFGSPPGNVEGGTNAALMLTNVQVTNQGPYEVVLADVQGSVTSSVANLYVVAPPTLQFSARNYSVAENAGSLALLVQRTGWLAPAVSVDYATADATATNGLKYTAVAGTLTFGASETNKLIVVPILNEGFVEGTKVFRVTLSNPRGSAVLGAGTTATVAITDNDVGTQFSVGSYAVARDAGAVELRIVRDDDGTLPATVDLLTTDLTATNAVDYVGLTNTLSFAPQERLKFVFISVLNNTVNQTARSFRVSLANPVAVSLGYQQTALVAITNSNQGFQFDSAIYSVTQDAGVVRLGVVRGSDNTNSEGTVDLTTSDESATNGVDYVALTNTLQFAPGETLERTVIPILNNGLKGPAKTFRVSLSQPTGSAVLGPRASVNVTIFNSNPGIGFETTAYTNAWSPGPGGTVALTVLRGNAAALGPVTVDYATSDLTAKSNTDYQAISGTLQFQQDETVKSLVIPLLRSRAAPGSKIFRVNLMNPTGGATLGNAHASVVIVGAFVRLAPLSNTSLGIQREDEADVVAWSGGGQLQRAASPTGPWQMLTNAASPFAVEPLMHSTFYRVSRPRPVDIYVPSTYDGQTPLPLVILLHNYSWNGALVEGYFQLQPLAETRGFLYCYPDSTVDPWGNPFWNATDACCDFWNTGVDDAGYLRAVIEAIASQFAVDRKRIYLIGISNGGFMAYRMACTSADLIAAIAADAGVGFLDPSRCHPVAPVNILHIHGTTDSIVSYDGGALTTINPMDPFPADLPQFPGVLQLMQFWAGYNGASGPVTDPAPTLDLTTDVPGLDTVVTRYTSAPPGGAVELWTVNGANHFFTLSPQFSPLVIDWLLSHPKP